MRNGTCALAAMLIVCVQTVGVWADPPEGPSNTSVLLPPSTFDVPVKAANTTRERYGEWSISGGVYLIQPVFDTNPAFLVSNANATRQVDFSHRLEGAPNIWLGYTSERGWGVRGRWFQFDDSASAAYTALPGETLTGMSAFALGRVPVSGTMAVSTDFAVNVGDIQATCTIDRVNWSHLLGIGIRYTHLSQNYRAALTNDSTRIDLASDHNLTGAGPSFSVETKRRIGASGFAVYGQFHGAVVFGHATESNTAINNATAQHFSTDGTRVLPVAELEVGAEYQRDVGRARLFLQAGFVGQAWWSGGNASNLDGAGFGSASGSNFGFLGLGLRAGVRY